MLTSKKSIMKGIGGIGINTEKVMFYDYYLDKKEKNFKSKKIGFNGDNIFVFFGTLNQFDVGITPQKEISEFDLSTGYVPGWYVCEMNGNGDNLRTIVINVGLCMEQEIDIFKVLKHELLHIANEGHCNKECFFSQKTSRPQHFCEKCEKDFKRLLINLGVQNYGNLQ